MDLTIQRTDSQRSQNNGNGPRVSFNRDVHVKRIGSRQSPADSHQQETPPRSVTPPVRRELPKDLTDEGILAEAARVLAQAESIKCTAQGGSDIVGGRLSTKTRGPIEAIRKFPESHFNSLPTRGKKKIKAPVTRSVSDASAKKSKKPSIFSLFSTRRDSGSDDNTGKRVTRSKSDVGTTRDRNTLPVRKRNNSENDEGVNAKKKAPPLSPIIESSHKENYFSENHDLRGPVKLDDLNIQPTKFVSSNIKEAITNLVTTQAKSTEDMHSSQQPAERPPLTKGLTVDGMVKRLSMERFSPPPQLTGPAFSYTRPKEQIIYAQVVCDGDKAKQTVHYAPSHLNGFHSDTNRRNGRPSQTPSPYRDKSPLHINGDRLQRKETPRVNSDEDEGLGFEIKRTYEEDFRSLVDEGPITPKIRDVPPEKYFMGNQTPAFQDLSKRRQNLQSRINNRRFGSKELLDTSPERDIRNGHQSIFDSTESRYQRSKSHDIDSVDNAKRFHKFGSQEVVSRYSPDRSHLDMTQTPSKVTSKFFEQSRYYHDGRDGYRETYRRETNIGPDGRPRTSESRSKERLDSPRRNTKEIDLGYIEDHQNFDVGHIEPNTSYFQDKYRHDQPRSLESTTSGDVMRSSPDQAFRQHLKASHLINGHRHESKDSYQNSLKRQQKHQRSFDKGDSGIENDYRKDSFNGDLQTRWRRRTVNDDIKSCELFLRKERRHTEDNHPIRRRLTYAYRERSIDDGSHFDPRLDKYPDGTMRKSRDSREKSVEKGAKNEKKKSSLEKVKQLLTGSGKKKVKEEKAKEKYMVKEEEMRARYSEYRGPSEGPKIHDIATRRRLSTPKASPIPRRTLSQKSTSKSSSNLSQQENTPTQKLSWFKSLDRLSRKNKNSSSRKTTSDDDFSSIQSPKPRPLSPRQENQGPTKNLRFFGDTDQESNASVSKGAWKIKARNPISSALNRGQKKYSRSAYDLDTISKGTKITSASKARSSSLQHLEEDVLLNGRTKTQSRDLHDISESASDNENRPIRQSSRNVPAKPSRGRNSLESTATSVIKSSTLNRRTNGVSSHDEDVENEIPFQRKRHYFEEVSRRHESPSRGHPTLRRELSFGGTGTNDYRKPPPGPQKPARLFEKRRAYSRERERLHDSSGTEGDSSQQSQRSVVYLHATTIGDIPQPMRRRAASRDDLSSSKSNRQRPMTRTVSRSVSVLAPWKPKHLHEGYEINYSQTQEKPRKFYHQDRKSPAAASTLNTKRDTTTLTRYKKATPRDEISFDKNSTPKNSFFTQARQAKSHKRDSESRNLSEISLTRRRDTPERLPATRRRWND